MPIYAYLCGNGHTHDRIEPMLRDDAAPNTSDSIDLSAERKCPECGEPAYRQFSAPQLKASGRYSFKQ